MHSIKISAIAACLLLFSFMEVHAVYRGENSQVNSYKPNTLIVKYKPGGNSISASGKSTTKTAIMNYISALNVEVKIRKVAPLLAEHITSDKSNTFDNVFLVQLENDLDLAALQEAYEKLPDVEYAEPDYVAEFLVSPDDSLYPFQWSLNNTGQGHYHVISNWGNNNDQQVLVNGIPDVDIDADEIYQNPPDQTSTVVVAIIDTGVDMLHPDLAANIWTNPREITDNGIDDDNNGYIDDVHGWDFAASTDPLDPGDNDPSDEYGHGTHCAGIIAAITNNTLGIAGIAANCRIMPLKFDPLPLVSRIARALIYAADNGADVVNMSFGLRFRSDLIEEAINYARNKGVILCASIGNDGGYSLNFPAGYDATIAIGATNDSDQVTSFSTIGSHLDVCAPGQSILSLRAGITDMYGREYPYEPKVHVVDSVYYIASGTSMSCPHVVGMAAEIRSVSPGLTPARTQEILQQSADDITDPYGVGWNLPGWDQYSGYGRVSLDKALMLIPKVRAKINSPMSNEICSGTVAITGIADGQDFAGYILEYGEGDDPSSWNLISGGTLPVTDSTFADWNTLGLSGRYTIRLRVGDYNISNASIYIANETIAQIISPSNGDTVANFASVVGSAYAPGMTHILLDYKSDTASNGWTDISSLTVPIFNASVGGWFLEDIPAGDYDLRLRLFSYENLLAVDSIAVQMHSIFSTDRAWKTHFDGYPTIIPNYGDLDNDGINEIIVGTSSGILVFCPDGTPKTNGLPYFPKNNYMVPVAVGNLNGDGVDDMVAAGFDPPKLYGFPSGGSRFECYLGIFPPVGNFYMTEHEFPKVFLKDIDNDNLDEIHVFVYDGSLSKAFIFDSDGTPINAFDYFSECLPADLDGNGIDEIYATNSGFCLLRKIDYVDGSTKDSLLLQMNGSNFNCMGLSAYDIDNDDRLELVVYGYYLDFGYWIYAFEDGLNPVDGWPHNMGIDDFVVPTAPIFGDIDGDGEAEYLTTYFDISASYVLAWNIDGTSLISGVSNGLLATTPEPSVMNMLLLADMDGNGSPDIVACADNDLFDTFRVQRIYAWNNQGKLLAGFPLVTSQKIYTGDRFTPLIGDINRDGNLDLIMTTPDSAQIFVNYPGVTFDSCSCPTPVWRYNRRFNNVGPLPAHCSPLSAEEAGDILPEQCGLDQNYPNPFNPNTRIGYALPAKSHVTISIYDILGRKIRTLIDDIKPAGNHSAEWNGRNDQGVIVSTGIYFYRLKSDGLVESKKMLFLK